MNDETIESINQWANETFGLASLAAQLKRVQLEAAELMGLHRKLRDAEVNHKPLPLDQIAEEAADMCICLYRIIGTLDPQAINKKMAINRQRKWKSNGNGTGQHIKEST